jgi:hypothetical protein
MLTRRLGTSGRALIGIALTVFLAPLAMARAQAFSTRTDIPTATEPLGLAVADFDGDSKSDVAVSIYEHGAGYHLTVWRNLSTPESLQFDLPLDFPAGTGPEGIAAGDLNGDGKADIAIASAGSSTVTFLRNVSTIGYVSFQSAPSLSLATPHQIVISDFDGDGKPDLIVTSNSGMHSIRGLILRSAVFPAISPWPTSTVTASRTLWFLSPTTTTWRYSATLAPREQSRLQLRFYFLPRPRQEELPLLI